MERRPRLLEQVRRVASEAAAPVVSRLAEGALKAAEFAGERARQRRGSGRTTPLEQLAHMAESLTRQAQRRLEKLSGAADRAGARGVETLGEVAERGTRAEVAVRQGRVREAVRGLGEELTRRGQQGLEQARQRSQQGLEQARQHSRSMAERMGVKGRTLGEAVAQRNAEVEAAATPPPLGEVQPAAPSKRRKTAPRPQPAPRQARAPRPRARQEPVVLEEGFNGKRGQKHKH
jgi:hypothetical protein